MRKVQEHELAVQNLQRQDNGLPAVKDTVRDIISNTNFDNFDIRPRSNSGGGQQGRQRVIQVGSKLRPCPVS